MRVKVARDDAAFAELSEAGLEVHMELVKPAQLGRALQIACGACGSLTHAERECCVGSGQGQTPRGERASLGCVGVSEHEEPLAGAGRDIGLLYPLHWA